MRIANRTLRLLLAIEALTLMALAVFNVLSDAGAQSAFSAFVLFAVGSLNGIACRDLRQKDGTKTRHPWELVSVLAAQASVIPILLVPLLVEWNSGFHDFADWVICLAIVVAITVASVILVKATLERPTVSINKAWVGLIALLPLATSLQFWYSTFYKPTHQRPVVNVTSTLEEVPGASTPRVASMRATVTLENRGPTDVAFFDSVYTVSVLETPVRGRGLTDEEFEQRLSPGVVAFNEVEKSYVGLAEVGRLIRPGGHLAPSQQLVTTFAFATPRIAQEKLRLVVSLRAVVGDGEALTQWRDCDAGLPYASTCREIPVPMQGWLIRELSDYPVVRTVIAQSPDSVPFVRTLFHYAGSEVSAGGIVRESDAEGVRTFINTRGFTSSTEYVWPAID